MTIVMLCLTIRGRITLETEIIERCAVCGEEIQPGTEHQDDDGHYYHPECCPGCDAADEGITLWTMIPEGWEDNVIQ